MLEPPGVLGGRLFLYIQTAPNSTTIIIKITIISGAPRLIIYSVLKVNFIVAQKQYHKITTSYNNAIVF